MSSHATATGQLQPLKERMNMHQQQRREQKIAARRIVAAQLQGQINLVAQYTAIFVHAGFWARLRWLFFGAKKGQKQNNG